MLTPKNLPLSPPGARAKKRGCCTPTIQAKTARPNRHKQEVTVCVREGNRAVPALRMYKNKTA